MKIPSKIKPKFKLPSKKRFEIVNFKVGSKKWSEWKAKGIDSNDAQLIYDKKYFNRSWSYELFKKTLLKMDKIFH